ncbi:hypothetical protein F5X96DRAFT_630391 [Biscogniauxia mediterranea]|nr:hypothetical protein F5X96DRAFT_630391 [Biscogniauxia mediterranea]
MAGLAPCAVSCFGEFIANSTCTPSDVVCQCSNADLNAQVSACILATCTVREALSAQNLTSLQCGVSPTVDHSYLPPMYALLVLAGVAVLLRLTSRLTKGTKLWWDDACNMLALLSGGAFLGIVIKATELGLGTDIWAIDQDNITPFFKLVLSFFQVYGICRIVIRCSIILFYIRIFSLTRASKLLWGTFAVRIWGYHPTIRYYTTTTRIYISRFLPL